MPGGSQPPYREPCGGSKTYLASNQKCGCSPFQQFVAAENNREQFIYNTAVPNWNTLAGGVIAPYERFAASVPDGCGGGCSYNPADPDPQPPCHGWFGTGYSDQYTLENPLPLPSWENSGQPVNFAQCQKYGYKNVQAARYWHGQPGWFFDYNPEVFGCNDPEWGMDCGDPIIYDLFSLTASQTKYLTFTYSVVYAEQVFECDGTPFATNNSSQSGSVTVNPESGVITTLGYSAPEDFCATGGSASGQYVAMLTWNVQDWVYNFFRPLLYLSSSCWGNAGSVVSCSSNGWTDNNFDGECYYPGTAGTLGSVSASWSSLVEGDKVVGFGASFSGSASADTSWDIQLSMTDSSLEFSINNTVNTCPDGSKTITKVTLSASLTNPNTPADIQSDVNSLLSYFPLDDDALYPWRTDSNTAIAPLVARNEVAGNVMPSTAIPPFIAINDGAGNEPCTGDWTPTYEPYVDPNSLICDGSIIGVPMPAGYQGWFDFYYLDYQSCNPGSGTIGYFYGWGQTNYGQMGIPRNATHWSPNTYGWQFGSGAWIFYNHNPSWGGCNDGENAYTFPPAPVCVAQKWAEIKLPCLSQNFARPAGADKFAYDETQVYTIQTVTGAGPGAVVQLAACETCITGVNDPPINPIGLWGGPSVGGFYEITGTNPVTLGNLIYAVPSDWQSASCASEAPCDTNYAFGLLRWPNSPAILGRVGVTAANTGPVELTTASPITTLGLGQTAYFADQIDIYDSKMNLLASGITVTRVDDSHFTVPVAYSDVKNAAYICSAGQQYWWNDNQQKGDFVYTDWTRWPRQVCEAQRWNSLIGGCDPTNCACPGGPQPLYEYDITGFTQSPNCIPFSPYAPSVIYITPNGETSANSVTYGFPTIQFDEEWGSGWQAEIQQQMQDLLYQSPHYPASPAAECSPAPFAWEMDNGSCQPSVPHVVYFAGAPFVEARTSVPAGFPGLPPGATIGWQSPVGILQGQPTPADALFPPPSNGFGLATTTVWAIWKNKCACIAGEGVFYQEYQQQTTGCPA